MRTSLYIETSVVSYLTARPSRDLITAARQQITTAWWASRRAQYDLFISPLVLEEAELGDLSAAAARIAVLQELTMVTPRAEADALAEALLQKTPLPEKAAADAVHIAIATTSGAEYLLTWNFKHIANPVLREQIMQLCRSMGYMPPTLCTPEDLLEGTAL
ncbi:MAG: type II toxin-antitoxin system VapC family toxin [Bacteroidota bacterium]